MLRVYFERFEGASLVPILFPQFGIYEPAKFLFLKNAFKLLTEPLVEVVDSPEKADYLLLPHDYFDVMLKAEYLQRYADLSSQHDKRILVFWHGDGDTPVRLPNATVFRTCQYRSALRPNEYIMPAYAGDLLDGRPLTIRPKTDIPVIGFCGWAEYASLRNRLSTHLKNSQWHLRATLTGSDRWRSRRKGLTIRREAIRALRGKNGISTNFLIRNSFSGHTRTIRLDPQAARDEYTENILSSDLCLTMRGDGNFSVRFFEVLSLGRVPLFMDTDCALPLEDRIDYASFMLKIDVSDMPHAAQRITSFWQRMPDEQFAEMQRNARQAFEQFLRIDRYLSYAVKNML